jgi:hypothetical protein
MINFLKNLIIDSVIFVFLKRLLRKELMIIISKFVLKVLLSVFRLLNSGCLKVIYQFELAQNALETSENNLNCLTELKDNLNQQKQQ